LTDIDSNPNIAAVAERIQRHLSEPFLVAGHEIVVYTSIGISLFPQDDKSVEDLLKSANSALYHAKQKGSNTFSFYSKVFNNDSTRRLAVESQLQRAMELQTFTLTYQPRVEGTTGKIVGAEALIRLPETDFGVVGPAEFIPIAEENGLIIPLTAWVLGEACKQAKAWQNIGFPEFRISVNLSARHFGNTKIVDTVCRTLNLTRLKPEQLELEITEGILMEDFELCVKILSRLKDLGLSIALDDFGTGYSSLNYLSRLPIDTLKIDRSFIKALPNEKENQAIIKAVVAVSRTLGLRVVAEGVETESQLLLARELGCHEIQGYLFSPPLGSDDFLSFLQKDRTTLRAIS
jgi:EAL domain-containing protein (putative c-di-GMP-specific phosphodiesterase class I)